MVIRINSGAFGRFNQYKCSTWYTTKLKESSGVADLYCLSPDGDSFWIELKREDGSQSDKQKKFMRHVRSKGGKYYIIRSIAQLKQRLKI